MEYKLNKLRPGLINFKYLKPLIVEHNMQVEISDIL